MIWVQYDYLAPTSSFLGTAGLFDLIVLFCLCFLASILHSCSAFTLRFSVCAVLFCCICNDVHSFCAGKRFQETGGQQDSSGQSFGLGEDS